MSGIMMGAPGGAGQHVMAPWVIRGLLLTPDLMNISSWILEHMPPTSGIAMGVSGGAGQRMMVLWAYWNALIYLLIIMYFISILFSHLTVAATGAMMGGGDDPMMGLMAAR
ncbi:hypothetical protein B0H16DRAFT_1727134 [Mycena metata]|uniref:Uncharacterized protein n=1 Tax=Mycena metata TaxID=1033252 RepID=A0AAD7ILJ5_9AGAR|nr:hypothetical protein B0H16DRAFT_1727134 [Mycena metata]